MAGARADSETLRQAAIDALFLTQKLGSYVAAAEFAGMNSNTISKAVREDESLSTTTARILRAAAQQIEDDAGVGAHVPVLQSETPGGLLSSTRNAIAHFEKGFKSLEAARERAMPISRTGFEHVEKEMRKIINTYLEPLVR